MKSPLFQTLNNYCRIFRCYQKIRGRREGKKKRQISDKMQELKEKKRKIQLKMQKELEGIKNEIH